MRHITSLLSSPRLYGRYFEGLIAKAVAAEAEANAPADEGLTDEEREEISGLRREVEAFTRQYEGLLDSLRADEVRWYIHASISCLGYKNHGHLLLGPSKLATRQVYQIKAYPNWVLEIQRLLRSLS